MMMLLPDPTKLGSSTTPRGTWESIVLDQTIPHVEPQELIHLAPIKEEKLYYSLTFGAPMQRTPSVSSASSSAYDSSVYHPSPIVSPRMLHQEPTASEKRTSSQPGSYKGAKKELKSPLKARTEQDRRDTIGITLGRMERVCTSNNERLRETAMPRQNRREGVMRRLGKNNIKKPHAATFGKKDVMELAMIQLEQDNMVFGDMLQELEEHGHNDHLWYSEMQALVRSGATQEALNECLNGRPAITNLPTRARYSLARRGGRDFQSPA
ncbi:hypothetical protein Alg130_02903 [Pyrenophora tritici-repentis]|nr:hypothetical protein Alg130_02903 [Pyrenophora tritici-repentis]